MAAEIEVRVDVDDSALNRLGQRAKGIGGALGSALKSGALVGGAAVAGLGVASIKMAADFEKSFAEVKTLLPGLGEEGFNKLRGDVLTLSKEMGIATADVVPALYQAISAGVPPDNVLTFMRTAAEASIGGVTDLETAVDGITSVVNAYGEEVVNAQQASDVMFTAVKLGKTDFSQLSSSLFNVIPTASALGVSFEDVSAALATITAAGTPTSVATTQLRAAFVEASKGGTELDKAIREQLGASFAELIESGANITQVFNTLREGMPEQEFKDLFGSVEGLNAVLGITGPNADNFASNLTEMQESTGATTEAFDVIAETTSFKFNRAMNLMRTQLMEVGLKALPVITQALERVLPWLEQNLPRAVEFARRTFEDLRPTIETLAHAFISGFQTIRPLLEGFWDFLRNNKPAMIAAIAAIGLALVLALGPVSAAAIAVAGIITAIGLFKDNSEEIKAKLMEIWGAVKSFLSDNWDEIATIALLLFTGPGGLIFAFTQNSFGIRDKMKEIWGAIIGLFRGWANEIIGAITSIPGKVGGALVSFKNAGLDLGKSLINGMVEGIRSAPSFAGGIAANIGDAIRSWLNSNVINRINRALEFDIKIPNPFGKDPTISINPPDIPRLARGGIVTQPTLAMLAEAGQAEAVIPLDRAGGFGFGGSVTVVFQGPVMGDRIQAERFARMVEQVLFRDARTR